MCRRVLRWTMPRKPAAPRAKSNPEQLKRFIDMAREVEVEEDPDAFDRAFNKVAPSIKPKDQSPKKG